MFCKPYIFKHVKIFFYLHLSIRTDLTQDLPDLGFEAHVQHPVGLVQNYIGAAPEVCLVHLKTASTLDAVSYLHSTSVTDPDLVSGIRCHFDLWIRDGWRPRNKLIAIFLSKKI